MSSNIPTRRIVRASKPTQSDENKTAKLTATTARIARLKTGNGGAEASTSATTTAKTVGGTGGTVVGGGAGHGGLDAGAKRKREALGEVTNGKGKAGALKGKKGTATTGEKDLKQQTEPLKAVIRRPRAEALREERGSSVDGSSSTDASAATKATSTSIASTTHGVGARRTIITKKKAYVYGDDDNAAASASAAEEEGSEPLAKKRRTSPDIPSDAESRTEVKSEGPHLEAIVEEAEMDAADVTAVVREGLEVEGWTDLDREDDDDPSMVSEYVNEIFDYFRSIEKNTLPDANYMEHQKELNWTHRGILVDFIIQLHGRYHLQQESLFLAINIMDRFMSRREVSMEKYQLVGCVAFFISTKTEETIAPSVKHIVEFCDKQFTEDEIFKAERYMLSTLGWDLSYPNPLNFLRRSSKADDYDVVRRTLAKYFCEIGCVEPRLVACAPSLIAAAAMWLARLSQDMHEWGPNLEHYSGYSERQIIPTAEIMISFLQKPIEHDYFHKKYASKKYYKASVWTRWWVRQLWDETEKVELAENLPKLKQIAAARTKFRAQQQANERGAAEVEAQGQVAAAAGGA